MSVLNKQVKLATYNIHACIGADRRFNPDRIIQVINEMDADILALQEVEHHRVNNQDLLQYLAHHTRHQAIPGPILLRDSRGYGNALLTRLPIQSINRVDLSVPGREPRGALDANFHAGSQRLRIIATHLGLKPGERRYQVRRLLDLLEQDSADINVLMGDLNEWFLFRKILRWLRAHFHATAHYPTFPARFPLLALDRIWIAPYNRILNLGVHDSECARKASDHLPLQGIIEI